MKIEFSDLTLGDDANDATIRDLSINGQVVFEAVDIVLAARKKFFVRGNEAVSLQFSVRREFSTHREAEVFALTHFSSLVKSGLCKITCGLDAEDTAEVFLANAILAASPQGGFNGVEAIVVYQIVAPAATTDEPPGIVLGARPMILYGSEAITGGESSVAVIFSEPFAAAPVVTATVGKPAGGDNIWATVDQESITTDGFTAYLSGPTPAEDYFLNWTAVGA
ncbi:MAG TPA: hypothetical protein VFV83_08760 [Chthoniobacteraceae bacterium]|nr:hypothetical protein [Chthoniobacteraceae bacterium]